MEVFEKIDKTFVYSLKPRTAYVRHYDEKTGRKYLEYGTLQRITFGGVIKKDINGNNMLLIGCSYQNPKDADDKKIGQEQAIENALTKPFMTLRSELKRFSQNDFIKLVNLMYSRFMICDKKRQIVLTPKERQMEINKK